MRADGMTNLEQMQADITSRVLNDPYLTLITVLSEHKGVSDADLQTTLSTMTRRGGKKGAAIIVGDVGFDVKIPTAPGPQIEPFLLVRCIEKPLVNRAPMTGTGITAEAMAIRVTRLLHWFQVQDLEVTLSAKSGDVITYKDGEREMVVRIETIMQLEVLQGCAYPLITGTHSAVMITCATPGSKIYYTTDGSTPGPENAAASIFDLNSAVEDSTDAPIEDSTGDSVDDSTTGVFSVAPGTLVRAVAFNPPTLVASNIAAKTIQ
jgi:hypothetical protein